MSTHAGFLLGVLLFTLLLAMPCASSVCGIWLCLDGFAPLQELQKDEVPEVDEEFEDASESTSGNFVTRAIEKILDLPGVSFLKPSFSGLLKTLAANMLLSLAAVAIPAVLFLVLLSSLFGGKRASSVVGILSMQQCFSCVTTVFTNLTDLPLCIVYQLASANIVLLFL